MLRHFTMPNEAVAASAARSPAPATKRLRLVTHIDSLWNTLTRFPPGAPRESSLLPLPRPYVVPGGWFRELYYWDSYFTMLGLAASGRRDLLDGMLDDFATLIDRYGHVPNGTRSYYVSRSQPPFYYAMVGLVGGSEPAADARCLSELRREYSFWMRGATQLHPGQARRHVVRLPDEAILNRYWDDRDTPRDESYRNDVMLARRSGRPASEVYRDLRAAAESKWDFSSRWFADGRRLRSIDTTEIVPVDLNALLYGLENAIRAGCERRGDLGCAREFAARAARISRLSAATLHPLFVGMASRRQAAAVAATVRRRLLAAGGVVALDRRGGGGEYPLQDGLGWTNGVTRELIDPYPSNLRVRRVAGCAAR